MFGMLGPTAAGRPDRALPAAHDPDQRHRLFVSAARTDKLLPSHIIGALSLVLLLIACIALYVMKLSGSWRWIYVVTALLSLYFNVFVLVIQSFLKIPALTAMAPGNPPSGPVFAVVQGVVLVFFVLMIIGAVRRFRPA